MSEESDLHALAEQLSDIAQSRSLSVATAESLTAGNLAAELGRAPASGDWFSGGVIAYSKAVKHSVLHVPPGPVVSEDAARAMANSVCSMMGANLAIALTGEAGPEPQEDVEPGTVWFGVCDHGVVSAEKHVFTGEPEDVLDKTLACALRILIGHARQYDASPT